FILIFFFFQSGVFSHRGRNRRYTCRNEQEGLPVDGPCGEQCICLDGRLEYCCRKRKNFASMTRGERLRYVNTVYRASTDRRYRGKYNRLIAIHSTNFMRGIHDRRQFLPWHRWYLLKYENLLREIDCRVTLPYWDWSLFPGAVWSQGEDEIWSSKPWGLGGNGQRGRRPGCVNQGRFNRRTWRVTPSAHRDCLRRSFGAKPPDIIAVYLTKAYSPRQFRQFELELRANLHDTLHCNVGGTMCNQYSANAPEFFLHHAFIDKIWADWQEKGTEHMDVYFRDLPSRTRMQAAQFHPQDYIDTLYLPHPDVNRRNAENICVIYKDPVHPMYDEVMSRLESLTTREVRQIRRRAFRPATSRQLRRLGVKRKERRQARRLLRMIEPGRQHRILTKSLKTTLDKMLGFSLKSIPFRANSIRDRPARSSVLRDVRWLANSLNSTTMSIGNFGDSASANISSTLV
ncbi:unnamed protein product, partial [Porites evermanni]